ncbi:MAG: hypothetical protein OJF60_002921 [Burkholderiaceae bacterium]|nr:MAG: hypothetical protein OJF60_002921 [Burkholderiaceae bacterium]
MRRRVRHPVARACMRAVRRLPVPGAFPFDHAVNATSLG